MIFLKNKHDKSEVIIKKINTPQNDFIIKALPKYDYSDTFSGEFFTNSDIDIAPIAQLFFNSSSIWARKLLHLRNQLVGYFGLVTKDIPKDKESKVTLAIGKRISLFKLYNFTKNELLFGEDDKHLDVRMILRNSTNTLTITTLIQYKNIWGKLYFNAIRIFHQQLIKSQLKNLIIQLNCTLPETQNIA